MKYLQVVVPDEWLAKLKKQCIEERMTLAQKLRNLIEKEIEEGPK